MPVPRPCRTLPSRPRPRRPRRFPDPRQPLAPSLPRPPPDPVLGWLVFFACRRPGWGEQFGRTAMAGFVVCLGSWR